MQILFDSQIFNHQKIGGVSRYNVELIKGLRQNGVKTILPVLLSNNKYLLNSEYFPFVSSFFSEKDFKLRNKIIGRVNRTFTDYYFARKNFDIFHPTYYERTFLSEKRLGKKPLVITVHDMINEYYGEDCLDVIAIKKELILRADKVIAITENTKKDILKYIDVDANKIEVVYHGANDLIEEQKPITFNNRPFILFVGARSGYKNFSNFIKAFAILANQNKDIDVVCTGKKFTKDEISYFKELKIENRISQIFATDAELTYLYKNCCLFIFPSLYEGFGLPILESMSCGAPTLLSNSSCFPEIAGDSAIYFDGTCADSILDTISKVLTDDSLKTELRIKGYKRVKGFTWEKTAQKTLSLYKELM